MPMTQHVAHTSSMILMIVAIRANVVGLQEPRPQCDSDNGWKRRPER